MLTLDELARVRYIEYSYWNELSGGSRLPGDAAKRIQAGVRVFDVSNAGLSRRLVSSGKECGFRRSFWPGGGGTLLCAWKVICG